MTDLNQTGLRLFDACGLPLLLLAHATQATDPFLSHRITYQSDHPNPQERRADAARSASSAREAGGGAQRQRTAGSVGRAPQRAPRTAPAHRPAVPGVGGLRSGPCGAFQRRAATEPPPFEAGMADPASCACCPPAAPFEACMTDPASCACCPLAPPLACMTDTCVLCVLPLCVPFCTAPARRPQTLRSVCQTLRLVRAAPLRPLCCM